MTAIIKSFALALSASVLLPNLPAADDSPKDPARKAEIKSYLRDLKDKDEPVRIEAVKKLVDNVAIHVSTDRESAYTEAIGPLIEALRNDPCDEVRWRSATALGQIGLCKKQPIPALEKEAVPALIEALTDKCETVRHRALGAFECIGAPAQAAVPHLIPLLKDKNIRPPGWSVARSTAATLARIGPGAKEAIPALIDLTCDKDTQLAATAATALGRIGLQDPNVMPTLLRLLNDSDRPHPQACAAGALGRIGKDARAAIPKMIELVDKSPWKDPDTANSVRVTLLNSLAAMGSESKDGVQLLAAILINRTEKASVREAAAYALSKIGSAASDAIPQLVEVFCIPKDTIHRTDVEAALVAIGEPAVPALIKAMENPAQNDKVRFMHVFEKMGPAAKEAVPALIKHVGPQRARHAIKAIEGK